MTKPRVSSEQRENETNLLRDAVNAHRAQKPAAEPSPAPKPERRRAPPLETPTPIPGFPLGPSRPGLDFPDLRTMETAVKRRQRRIGASLQTKVNEVQLVKKRVTE